MQKITVRKIEKSDIPQASKLVQNMWLLHADNCSFLSREKITKFNAEKYLLDTLEDKNKIFYVAVSDDVVIGTVMGVIQNCPEYYRFEKEFYIDDLSVEESFQRRGVATLLIGELLTEAEKRDLQHITAKLYKFNVSTQKLFESFSFTEDYGFYSRK